MKTLVCYMAASGAQTIHGHLVWTSDTFDMYELDRAREDIADIHKCRMKDVAFTSIARLDD